MDSSPLSPQWFSDLLAQRTQEAQAAFVHDAGLLDESGLDQILSETTKLLRQDPHLASQLAGVCQILAIQIDAPKFVPRSVYLRAQVASVSGDFEQARTLIEEARGGYETLGLRLQALRTNAGLMTVLSEVGEFQQALDIGDAALAQLQSEIDKQTHKDDELAEEEQLIAALIHSARGIAFGEVGQYQSSIESFDSAQAIYESLGLIEQVANVLNNRGVSLRYIGYISESLQAYRQSYQLIPDDSYARAITLTNIGDAEQLLGNYRASLTSFQEAEALFAQLDTPTDQLSCVQHMADVYLALNLYAEALVSYQQVADALRQTDSIYLLAMALWGMGSAHIERGELVMASSVLEEARQLFLAMGNIPLQSAILLEQATLAQVKGDLEQALTVANQALSLIATEETQPSRQSSSRQSSGWSLQTVYAHMTLADLYLQHAPPDLASVERHLMAAEQLATPLSIPHLRYRLDQRFGHLRMLEGKFSEAQSHLEAAIDRIEQLRGSMPHEAMRTSFLHDKMTAYRDLVQLYIEQATLEGDDLSDENRQEKRFVERIFGVMERAKSRVLAEVISGVVEAKIEASSQPEVVAKLHMLQAELKAIYNELFEQGLNSSQTDHQGHHTERRVPALQRRTAELEESITRLRLQLASQVDERERFAQPLSLAEIQTRIPDDLGILNYHVLGDEILVLVITCTQTKLFRHVGSKAKVRELLQRLGRLMEPFQGGQQVIERHMTRLAKNAQHLLTMLYRELLGELTDYLSLAPFQNHRLTIVPHDLLHQVPFHALFDAEQYLLERFEIAYAPSATTYALTQTKLGNYRGDSEGAILVVGIPDPAIPAVEAEINAIASIHADAYVLQQEKATTAQLIKHLDHAPILHMACHGLFHTDNPMYSALKLQNSWLTAIEIAEMDLQGKLIVLSACESGRGRLLGGDENIGLTRACLGSGASTLIVSLWRVQDEATAILMTEFYTRLSRGHSPAAALRQAQIATMSSHPHPYFWAPFVLVGSRN